jgi:hypothetical protein
MKKIKLQCETADITVNEVDGVYSIESNLLSDLDEAEDEMNGESPELRAAISAVEMMIIAHAEAGAKVGSKAYGEGVDNALEAIVSNLE